MKAAPAIRLAQLPAPFVYRSMADVEQSRTQQPDEPHRHDHYSLIVVESAEGTHQIDFHTFPLTPHTVYFVGPEQVHHLQISAGTPVGHVLLFTNDFLVQYSLPPEQLRQLGLFFNCDETRPLVLDAADIQQILPLVAGIRAEMAQAQPDQWAAVGAWLKLLLLTCNRLKINLQQENAPREHRQAEIVRRFKDEVEQHFREWHKVADYARALHLTGNYLNDIVRSETGTSAKDFIQNRLVLEAKRLTLYSDLSAKEIAHQLGYDDVAHFSKFFKKCAGVGFAEFKRSSSDD